MHQNHDNTIVRVDCENSEEEEQYSSEHQEEDKVANVDVHDSEVTEEAGRSKPRKTKGNVGHCSEQTTINESARSIDYYSYHLITYRQAVPQRVQLYFHGLN